MILPIRKNTIIFLYSLISFLFLQEINAVSVAPVWITSSYVQADSRRVINGDICSCTTGNTATPTATMTFTTAFTVVPNIGYGISNYQGK
jgi:hypothetical protein